jgi:membrane associated rhomboid family serine protease
MFLLPIRSDRRLAHVPWMNYALVASNLLVFLAAKQHIEMADQHIADPITNYYLDPNRIRLFHGVPYQFFTYQFLHDGWLHVGGNMLFLYVFGASVEDRLGKLGYLAFYLAGGVVAGLGHCLIDSAPVLGASGAVAAVTGAYLALFPLSNITIFYWFFLIGTFEISSMWVIGLQIAQNVFMTLAGAGVVAYTAHLAGYAYGFMVGMGLLWSRFLSREPYDLLAMFERHQRRRQFAALTRDGYQPWMGAPPVLQGAGASAGVGNASAQASQPQDAHQARIMEQRARVNAALSRNDLPTAAVAYARLLEIDPEQTLSQQGQLDLANQFMSEGRHNLAARAYELFLRHYGSYVQREQVQLILGLIYARYLHLKPRAVELLKAALERLSDGPQRDLARQTLAELGA